MDRILLQYQVAEMITYIHPPTMVQVGLNEQVLERNISRLMGGEDILEEFLTFLYEWFSEHTIGTDYRLTQYISEHQG